MVTAAEIIYDFDYTELDAERRIIVQQKASEIKSLLRQRAANAIEIGQKLIEAKEALGYGNYRRWLEAEFTWGKTLANDFENVAKQFADVRNVDNFDSSALRLLASPSVPDEAREEAKALAEAGDHVSHADAQAIAAKHKPAKQDKPTKPQPPDRFPVGSSQTVASGEHQGKKVEVLESDGVMIRGKTKEGEIVPLMSAELEPEPEPESKPPAPLKSAAPPPAIELLSIELDIAKSRVAHLEGRVRRLVDFLANAIQYLPSKRLKQTARELLRGVEPQADS